MKRSYEIIDGFILRLFHDTSTGRLFSIIDLYNEYHAMSDGDKIWYENSFLYYVSSKLTINGGTLNELIVSQ